VKSYEYLEYDPITLCDSLARKDVELRAAWIDKVCTEFEEIGLDNYNHNFKNISRRRFDRLIALYPKGRTKACKVIWLCLCDCNNTVLAVAGDLRSGRVRSCGCLHKETACNNLPIVKHGNKHPNWKGGSFRGSGGYIYTYRPEHPNATLGGYMLESRLVMEGKVGRFLTPEERVHHEDRDVTNNKPGNLILFENDREHKLYHDQQKKQEAKR